jgi:hypothetical protein
MTAGMGYSYREGVDSIISFSRFIAMVLISTVQGIPCDNNFLDIRVGLAGRGHLFKLHRDPNHPVIANPQRSKKTSIDADRLVVACGGHLYRTVSN